MLGPEEFHQPDSALGERVDRVLPTRGERGRVHQETDALAQERLALALDHAVEAGKHPRPPGRAGQGGKQRRGREEGASVQAAAAVHDGKPNRQVTSRSP